MIYQFSNGVGYDELLHQRAYGYRKDIDKTRNVSNGPTQISSTKICIYIILTLMTTTKKKIFGSRVVKIINIYFKLYLFIKHK